MLEWIATASLLILVVLLLRTTMGNRISAGLRYGLWLVVLVRLLVPGAFLALWVTVPQLPTWTPPEAMQEESIYVLPVNISPLETSGVHVFEDGKLGDPNSFGYPRLTGDGERVVRYAGKISPLELLRWVWIAGAAAMGAVLVIANLRFSVRLRRVRKLLEGTSAPIPVYVAAGLPSPCLLGLLRPAVYVTEEAAADPAMLRHVLAHELTHYNHLDHMWSILRGVALAVHWWNPLVWLAVVCSRRDGELACDEGALKRLGDGERTAYGETLLALVTARSKPGDLLCFATTMTGGKRSLKERIQRIAKRPRQLVSAMVVVIVIASLSVLVAFGQAKEEEKPDTPTRHEDPTAQTDRPAGAWQTAQITVDENGIPYIDYSYGNTKEFLNGEPIPAPREWADDDLAERNEAAALIGSPEIWAQLV
ncbi:MAG: M56 family metallopeptidase, partial [Oscillospiraceae bacterium]|nr:M56 family metallopeptidase [Oscillospiraceae bacterium]